MQLEDLKAGRGAAFAAAERNFVLEAIVEQRTSELAEKVQELEGTLRELHEAQATLLSAQRLQSIGQLAAGIAHEINTPLQYVGDSAAFITNSVTDLLGLLDAYAEIGARCSEGWDEHRSSADDRADLPYLRAELPPAIQRMTEGLGRVTHIVCSMKEFANPAAADIVSVDLNQAIETTLTVCGHEWRPVARVELELGQLPRVMCHPGDVNQALLNVIVNAAQAIAHRRKDGDPPGCITVRSARDGDRVLITIADDGGGIAEAIQDRVFEPFFTTRDVGHGTGQGLAIAWNVIVKGHGGGVWFESRPGVGTTFFIQLPIEARGARPG